MTSPGPIVIDQGEDGVAVVTLNRPESLNAADEELHGAIASVWSALAERPDCRAVVITGPARPSRPAATCRCWIA